MGDTRLIARWYYDCMTELTREFPRVEYDRERLTSLMIYDFPLPITLSPRCSDLYITTPGLNISNAAEYKFYLDMNIKLNYVPSQNHLFKNNNYNDMQRHNLSRISFHLKSFRPAMPIHEGDTLIDICMAFHAFLGERW